MTAPERAPIRAVVRTAVHGQAVTCCVCHCGELLVGMPARCPNKHCRRWYSTAEILEALDRFAPLTEDEAA